MRRQPLEPRTLVRLPQRFRSTLRAVCVGALASAAAGPAFAHSFGTPYVPPMPLWMYVYGGAATLIVTFAILGMSMGAPVQTQDAQGRPVTAEPVYFRLSHRAIGLLRAGAVAALLLTVLAGFMGSQDPVENVSMTLFWVIFLLGFTYLTLFTGDLYRFINPWKTGVEALERTGLDLSNSRLTYPANVGYWPAIALYAALIWMELFVGSTPRGLSWALLLYTTLTIVGTALFGKAIWFERADPFAVFFRLIGLLAPLEYRAPDDGASWNARVRAPFSGALTERPERLSLVVFMLLVLAATSYDAIHETTLWVGLYWKNLLWLLQPLWGDDLGKAQSTLMGGYLVYRQVGLVAFPFFYLLLYGLALWIAKVLMGTRIPLRTLALSFCYSLLPIVIAYHFTHYLPFLIAEAGNFLPRLSDPFGFGWNELGTDLQSEPEPLPMDLIWHTQVAVLVFGHLVSVYLAHRIAIQTFPTRRQAIVSQLPLLVLMVAYTIFGLWILSLPLAE